MDKLRMDKNLALRARFGRATAKPQRRVLCMGSTPELHGLLRQMRRGRPETPSQLFQNFGKKKTEMRRLS